MHGSARSRDRAEPRRAVRLLRRSGAGVGSGGRSSRCGRIRRGRVGRRYTAAMCRSSLRLRRGCGIMGCGNCRFLVGRCGRRVGGSHGGLARTGGGRWRCAVRRGRMRRGRGACGSSRFNCWRFCCLGAWVYCGGGLGGRCRLCTSRLSVRRRLLSLGRGRGVCRRGSFRLHGLRHGHVGARRRLLGRLLRRTCRRRCRKRPHLGKPRSGKGCANDERKGDQPPRPARRAVLLTVADADAGLAPDIAGNGCLAQFAALAEPLVGESQPAGRHFIHAGVILHAYRSLLGGIANGNNGNPE